jgi:hypothetical protein
LSQKECFYCGSLPANKYNSYINLNGKIKEGVSKEWANQSWFIYNGLDRIDSSLLHTEDNIVPCCKICNYAKRSMSLNEFKNWATGLAQNLAYGKW